ncbi:MAG: hypothetical protein BA864_07115 [Desulfuromonadales bacterium C00003093]|nr:MAG: hypothetical protein BA864_07115 [Desulfuromonadales bacterium C00003093]
MPAYPTRTAAPSLYPSAILATGLLGAVATGAAALAVDLHRVQDEQISMSQAVADSLLKGAGGGVAVAAATAAARSVGGGGLINLAVMVATATGVGFLLTTAGRSAAAKAAASKPEK